MEVEGKAGGVNGMNQVEVGKLRRLLACCSLLPDAISNSLNSPANHDQGRGQ